MKTKTTNGKTVVVATEQERHTLDRAIDVLIQYGYLQYENDSVRASDEAVQNIRTVIADLKTMAEQGKKETPPASPAPVKPAAAKGDPPTKPAK